MNGRKCVLSTGPQQLIKLDHAVRQVAVNQHKVTAPGKRQESRQPMIITFSSIPKTVRADPEVLLTKHFYTSFLQMNNFTGRPVLASNTIHPFLESSPALSNVAMAISSMITQRKQSSDSLPRTQSIKFYRQAVASLQKDLQDQHLNYNYSVLWSTFFLGLFEVCLSSAVHFLAHS